MESIMNKRMLGVWLLAMGWALPAPAAEALSSGQSLYLPIYSHVWHGDRVVDGKYPLKTLVSSLVSIRNTSLKTPIKVTSARYYGTDGKLLKEYVAAPITVGPMGTYELFIEKKESAGGSGANFVIQWESAQPTNPPVVEALHADIKGHQTLTFVTTARPIQPDK
jgi:hypothetical protein